MRHAFKKLFLPPLQPKKSLGFHFFFFSLAISFSLHTLALPWLGPLDSALIEWPDTLDKPHIIRQMPTRIIQQLDEALRKDKANVLSIHAINKDLFLSAFHAWFQGFKEGLRGAMLNLPGPFDPSFFDCVTQGYQEGFRRLHLLLYALQNQE